MNTLVSNISLSGTLIALDIPKNITMQKFGLF